MLMTKAFFPSFPFNAGLPPPFQAGAQGPHDDAILAMALASGGDARVDLGADGRNPYGAPIRPAKGDVWFASSTASAISARGWEAAGAALPRAFGAAGAENWFGDLRQRLLSAFAPPGADLIFCASGTQAEYAALAVARALDGDRSRPICNVLVAPDETGRGAPLAAAGRHFLDSAPFGVASAGAQIAGFADATRLETVPIRDAAGAALSVEEIDAQAASRARNFSARGFRVLLHVLDCSKTGLAGVSREAAQKRMAEFPEHLSVVVDACQLRCQASQIRADLAAGFMVMLTGSKFAGGPAFSGALLLPPAVSERLARLRSFPWPEGLSAHSALLDWPPALRVKIAGPFGARVNSGLGLRWEAALAEIEAFSALDPAHAARAVALFGVEARKNIARCPGLLLMETPEPTILPILSRDVSGAPLPAGPILHALRAKGFFIGQGVKIGGGEVLRLCLAAPQIVDFALRRKRGADETSAFAPLARDMTALFDAWRALLEAN
jgi:hypothetical protein